jgi:hypothetical protein
MHYNDKYFNILYGFPISTGGTYLPPKLKAGARPRFESGTDETPAKVLSLTVCVKAGKHLHIYGTPLILIAG